MSRLHGALESLEFRMSGFWAFISNDQGNFIYLSLCIMGQLIPCFPYPRRRPRRYPVHRQRNSPECTVGVFYSLPSEGYRDKGIPRNAQCDDCGQDAVSGYRDKGIPWNAQYSTRKFTEVSWYRDKGISRNVQLEPLKDLFVWV